MSLGSTLWLFNRKHFIFTFLEIFFRFILQVPKNRRTLASRLVKFEETRNLEHWKSQLWESDTDTIFHICMTHTKMDAHNVPGAKDVVAPVAFDGGKIDGNALVLDVPAKSVVVVRLD